MNVDALFVADQVLLSFHRLSGARVIQRILSRVHSDFEQSRSHKLRTLNLNSNVCNSMGLDIFGY